MCRSYQWNSISLKHDFDATINDKVNKIIFFRVHEIYSSFTVNHIRRNMQRSIQSCSIWKLYQIFVFYFFIVPNIFTIWHNEFIISIQNCFFCQIMNIHPTNFSTYCSKSSIFDICHGSAWRCNDCKFCVFIMSACGVVYKKSIFINFKIVCRIVRQCNCSTGESIICGSNHDISWIDLNL